MIIRYYQDVRQRHFPGKQNRSEDRYRYEEEAYHRDEEDKHVFQTLILD